MVDIIPRYNLPHIHCMMLGDNERLTAYNTALKNLVKGKVVLDYGAGTGILSMIAARAGAKEVYAIELTNADLTRQIIEKNKLENKIEIIEKSILDIDLPNVEVIVSEWMGFWALQENMLPGLLYARDNFLKKGGIILPNKINLHLVPSSEPINDIPNFKDLKGFNLEPYLTNVTSQPFVSLANPKYFLSESKKTHSLDIASMSAENCTSLDLEESYPIKKDGKITCLYGWFDAEFYNASNLDTSPKKITHWQQARFLLEKQVPVKNGENINIRLQSGVSDKDNQLIKFKTRVLK